MRDHACVGLAATAWVVGLMALTCDYLQPSRSLILGVRAFFGIMTCAAICLALIPKARSLAGAPRAELYLFARLVSRWVYISMYGLALVRVGLSLYDATQHCTVCGTQSTMAPVRSLEDFQYYIACCVVPLWLVRAIVLVVPFNPIRSVTSSTACPTDAIAHR